VSLRPRRVRHRRVRAADRRLDADNFARDYANHLVDVLDDPSAVARTEEMVWLQRLQNDLMKNVKLEDQFFQKVRGLFACSLP
jgi:hypothetical protein